MIIYIFLHIWAFSLGILVICRICAHPNWKYTGLLAQWTVAWIVSNLRFHHPSTVEWDRAPATPMRDSWWMKWMISIIVEFIMLPLWRFLEIHLDLRMRGSSQFGWQNRVPLDVSLSVSHKLYFWCPFEWKKSSDI